MKVTRPITMPSMFHHLHGLQKAVLPMALLTLMATSMVGCNRGINPEVHKPVPLVKLEQPLNVLSPVLNVKVANSARNTKDPLDLQVGYDGSQVVSASRNGVISAYDLSGKRLWSVDVGEPITGGVAYDRLSHTAVISTRSGKVQAFDGFSGNKRWQHQLSGTVLSPALIHNNRVILSANDGFLHGLSLQTGKPVWQFATQVPSISVRGSATPTLLDNDTALIATADGRIHAITIDSGIPLWSNRIGLSVGSSEIERMSDVDATPIIDNNQLYAISYSGRLSAVDLDSKQVLFIKDVASLRAVAVTPQLVVVTTLDGQVIAYDRNTGQEMWQSDDLLYRQLTNPVFIGNYIAVGDYEGAVSLYDPQTGKIIGRVNTQGALTSLQVVGRRLITQSSNGQMTIWQLVR